MNITSAGDGVPWNNPARGWVCPLCGRGVSPHTNVCPCVETPSYNPSPVPWHPPLTPWTPKSPTIPDPWTKPWETTPWNPDPTSPDWTWRPKFGPWYTTCDLTRLTC